MYIIWLTCKYRPPCSGETPQEKWSSRLQDWKWFQFNLKIPSLMASVMAFLIHSKSHDNHFSLPSREAAPVGIGLSLLFHETLSVISLCGWSDSCFHVFGENILLQNCDFAAFELFPLPNLSMNQPLALGNPASLCKQGLLPPLTPLSPVEKQD